MQAQGITRFLNNYITAQKGIYIGSERYRGEIEGPQKNLSGIHRYTNLLRANHHGNTPPDGRTRYAKTVTRI